MRILQVIPWYAPAWGFGGPVKVCQDLSQELVKKGHKVWVATTDAYDCATRVAKRRETLGGVKVRRFANLSPRAAKGANLYLPLGYKGWMQRNIRRFDLVHCHAFFTYQNVVAARLCRKEKIPYILHLHESPVPQPLLGKVGVKKTFNALWGKRLLRGAAKIFVLSEKERKVVARYLPEVAGKLVVVPNSLAPGKFRPRPGTRERLGLKKTDKVILYLGRLSFIKGLDRLINAFARLQRCSSFGQARLARQDTRWQLILAGPDEGGEEARLREQVERLRIEQQVHFLGLVEGERKEDCYAAADIFALFSLYESFSIVTIEALSHNLPVCLTKEVGIAEEVSGSNCAVLVDRSGSARRSAGQLEETYRKRRQLAQNCPAALKKFDQKTIFAKILKVYHQVASPPCL